MWQTNDPASSLAKDGDPNTVDQWINTVDW